MQDSLPAVFGKFVFGGDVSKFKKSKKDPVGNDEIQLHLSLWSLSLFYNSLV